MCEHKNIKEEMQTFKNGTKHLRQSCIDCNKFIGFVQQELPLNFIMPFGKHKGKMFKDLDISYLKWLINQDWVKKNMLDKANEIISGNKNPCYNCGSHVCDLSLSLCANCAYN